MMVANWWGWLKGRRDIQMVVVMGDIGKSAIPRKRKLNEKLNEKWSNLRKEWMRQERDWKKGEKMLKKKEVKFRMNKPRSPKNCWAKTMKNSFSWLSLTSAMIKRWWQGICLYNGCVYLWGGNLVLREKSMEAGSVWLQETLRGCSTVG